MKIIYYTLMNWFSAKAMETLEERLAEKMNEKQEGSKQEKKSAQTDCEKIENENFNRADIGILFASGQELAGFFDIMPKPKITMGNDLKYRTVVWNHLRIAAIESGFGAKNVQKATDVMIKVFRPLRILSAGFATSLVPELKKNQLVICDRLIRALNGDVIDFRSRALGAPDFQSDEIHGANSPENEIDPSFIEAHPVLSSAEYQKMEKRFASGTLLSLKDIPASIEKRESIAKKYGASLCDRETWHIANICIQAGIPFLSLRIITEELKELSKPVHKMKNNSDSMSRWLGALVGTVMKNPKGLVDIFNNRQDLLIASDELGKMIRDII